MENIRVETRSLWRMGVGGSCALSGTLRLSVGWDLTPRSHCASRFQYTRCLIRSDINSNTTQRALFLLVGLIEVALDR